MTRGAAVQPVSDERDQAVELVAEAGGGGGPVGEHAVGPGLDDRDPGGVGQQVRPRRPPVESGAVGRGQSRGRPGPASAAPDRWRSPSTKAAATVWTWASKTVSPADHHNPSRRPSTGGPPADVGRVATREQGLRQDEPDAPAVGPGQAEGERQELDGGIGVRAASVVRAAPARGRAGQLVEERRVADDDVELPEVAHPQGVAEQDGGLRTEPPPGLGRGRGVELDPDQRRTVAARARTEAPVDAGRGGGQEATVAAGRIEHPEARRGRPRRQHRVEDDVEEVLDEPVRRGPRAPGLAIEQAARHGPPLHDGSASHRGRRTGSRGGLPVYSRRLWPSRGT